MASGTKILFLGTGANDHDWSGSYGRGSCSTLIDGRLLIDFGPTGMRSLTRWKVDSAKLDALLFTHSHDDHFDPGQLRLLLDSRRKPLHIYANPKLLRRIKHPNHIPHAVKWGDKVDVAGVETLVLPSNHSVEDIREETFHFYFKLSCGNLLYALDGAWMMMKVKRLLAGERIDLIIWDATVKDAGNFRFMEHNDLKMIELMKRGLADMGLIDGSTVHIFDHIARTLWPASDVQCEKAASRCGALLAHDGMSYTLSRNFSREPKRYVPGSCPFVWE